MKNSQFTPTPIACPNCGFHIGEQAYFQSFEQKSANWLGGQIAPTATKGYDVKGMEGNPNLTFQVKYCTAHPYVLKGKTEPQLVWGWMQKSKIEDMADFFILFGLFENGQEFCFLLNKTDFISGCTMTKQGWHHYRSSAKRFLESRKAGMPSQVYGYEIQDPAKNLIEAVKNYQPGKKAEWVKVTCKICHEDDRAIYGWGMCQRCYQRTHPRKNNDLYNERRRAKYRAEHPK